MGEGSTLVILLGEENPQQISTLQVKELPLLRLRLVLTVDFEGFG